MASKKVYLSPTHLEKLAIIKDLSESISDWCADPMLDPDDLAGYASRALEWIRTLKGYTGKSLEERVSDAQERI